jgi:hypothetical protein
MRNPGHFLLPAALALLMLATRFDHFGSSVNLPDASLAAFFLAGFYLRGRFVFPLLMTEAALIDYIAIAHFGVSDFCVSPAYVFLIPAYAAAWTAGLWLRGKAGWEWATLPRLAAAWFVGAALAFLLSDGSFYWLSGRYAEPHAGQYIGLAAQYFLPYLSGPFLYVALAAALHGLLHGLRTLRPAGGHEAGR